MSTSYKRLQNQLLFRSKFQLNFHEKHLSLTENNQTAGIATAQSRGMLVVIFTTLLFRNNYEKYIILFDIFFTSYFL